MKNKAIFLDRDGVMNKEGWGPVGIQDLQLIPEAIEALKHIPPNYKKIIITNQGYIERGILTKEQVHEVHEAIKKECASQGITIDAIYFCPHLEESNCHCRKPKPGMLLQAQQDHNIDLKESYMIGDMLRDVEAGQQAGCKKSILLKRDHSHLFSNLNIKPDHSVNNLIEAIKIIFPD